MTAAGSFTAGGTVVFTVVLTNSGPRDQGDAPGNEFTDVLPAALDLTGATATAGTARAERTSNTVTWNGGIVRGGAVTISITARVRAPAGATVSNQGTIAYDSNGDGTNDASALTYSPSALDATTATRFAVGAESWLERLDWPALLAIAGLVAALFAALGVWWTRVLSHG